MFTFPTQMRKSLFPNTEKWFEKLMNSPQVIKSYGRTVLCKNPMKPFNGKIERPYLNIENKENGNGEIKDKKGKKGKKGKNKDQENTKGKELVKEIVKKPYFPGLLEIDRFNIKEKTNNPLDALPETKFDLEKFKKILLIIRIKREQ